MRTTSPHRSFLMQYRPEDFPLYLLSLGLTGSLIVPVLPYRFEQLLLIASLAYLACFFLIRHGAKFEANVLPVVFEGVRRYPTILARNWRTARDAVVPIVVVFVLAVSGEGLFGAPLAGTRWLDPFPWGWVVWIPFLAITLFRLSILIAHFERASVVRAVLENSTQKKTIASLPIQQHILHAFVTGMLAHLSLIAPCALFFIWTRPSNLREALLAAGYVLWSAIASPLRKRRFIEKPNKIGFNLVYNNHTIAHQSRFFFTVFHGHHHDAIPSALIGSAGGTGFLENTDRGLTWLDFLNSVVVMQISWAYSIVFDMIVHQYIPGVFPFAKVTVLGTAHHVTHHFGSALPLGLIFDSYVEERDLNNGYKPDNAVTRWFLAEVEQHEGLDPELGKKFLSLNNYAR